jgi:hypothetical protein
VIPSSGASAMSASGISCASMRGCFKRAQLEADLAEGTAADEARLRESRAQEALAIAADLRKSKLPEHIAGVVIAIDEMLDDVDRAQRLTGGGPSPEGAQINVRNLLLTAFAKFPWRRFGPPDRRWGADDLLQSWGDAVDGSARE